MNPTWKTNDLLSAQQLLLLLLIMLTCMTIASATILPVPPPVHCDATECTVSTFQQQWADRTPCKAAMALYPTSEEELLRAVAYAAKTKIKVKAVSKEAHTLLKLICPSGDDGLIISTRDYNTHIIVNVTQKTVTADAGVMLRDLVDTIAEFGLTLPHTTIWDGVSVAGMISTGSHGSSVWRNGSCPHDRVIGIRLITAAPQEEGYVKMRDLTSKDEDLNAAKVSLGVLGVISQVTFQLESMFKRSVTFDIRGDQDLESEILDFARQHEFGAAFWYPSSGKTLFRLDDRVSVDEEGDGAVKDPLLDQTQAQVIEDLALHWQASDTRDKIGEVCMEGDAILHHRFQSGDGYVNSRDDNIFTGYPVIGYNNLMQTSGGCRREAAPKLMRTAMSGMVDIGADDVVAGGADNYMASMQADQSRKQLSTCVWNPLVKGLTFHFISIAVPASRIGEAIAEVKKLREADPQGLCGLGQFGAGIWMRFLRASEAYLGQREDAVTWEMIVGRSRGQPLPYISSTGAMQEVEQMLLDRYGGRPHWGKNRELAFENMAGKVTDMAAFLAARARLDPLGLFSNEWSDAVLGISTDQSDSDSTSSSPSSSSPSSSLTSSGRRSVQILRDGCALEGLCVCRDNSHCLPAKGFFCRPGLVYKEARVCRYVEEEHRDRHMRPQPNNIPLHTEL